MAGHDFGKGDMVEIEGTVHEVTDMRRMQVQWEAVTLIAEARSLGEQKTPDAALATAGANVILPW